MNRNVYFGAPVFAHAGPPPGQVAQPLAPPNQPGFGAPLPVDTVRTLNQANQKLCAMTKNPKYHPFWQSMLGLGCNYDPRDPDHPINQAFGNQVTAACSTNPEACNIIKAIANQACALSRSDFGAFNNGVCGLAFKTTCAPNDPQCGRAYKDVPAAQRIQNHCQMCASDPAYEGTIMGMHTNTSAQAFRQRTGLSPCSVCSILPPLAR